MRECKICKRINNLNTIEIEEDGAKWEIQVCHNCWEAIAAVAHKAMAQRLIALEDRVENMAQALLDYKITS